MREGATRTLVGGARALAFDALPPEAVLVAKTCVLDWLGCALAGSREPLGGMLAGEAEGQGGTPQATLVGHDRRTSILWAALVNGAASHALDFDDTHLGMMGHPSAPVCPAVLALAEARGAGGRSLLTAFVAGVETECRLGLLIGPGHYATGWHSTATLGAFGAATACAHLLGLDEDAFTHALGLAGVQAAGLKAVFGTMAKPFQVGRAAQNGLLAATLAERGFTSSTGILEAPQGFGATHAATELDAGLLDELADRWLVGETVFKYHASCYLTHSAMDAALALSQRVPPDSLEEVRILVPARHLGVCNIAEPTTGLEGKFSLRATVAMALLGDDTSDPAAFSDERMRSPELVGLRDRVSVCASDDLAGTQAVVVVRTTGGEEHGESLDVGRPAKDLTGQWERITAKFLRLAAPVVGKERAVRLHALVRRMEELDDVSELTSLCRVGAG
jgi:2-methylcitrate dehydratase PrpD